MFRRRRYHASSYDEEQAQGTLERLAALTDRLEDTTQALAVLVAELDADMHRQEQGAEP